MKRKCLQFLLGTSLPPMNKSGKFSLDNLLWGVTAMPPYPIRRSLNGQPSDVGGHDNGVREPNLPLLPRHAVSPVCREPYILEGYRKENCSYAVCLRYAFVLHNDVGNFWTHSLPLLVWLPWLFALSYWIDFSDSYFWPLLCYWAGACSYVSFSATAHLLANKSFTVRTVCFILDYLGIAMYAFGTGMVIFFYGQPASSPLYWYRWPVLIVEAVASINAVLLCALSRFFCLRERFVIRAIAFAPIYFTGMVPFAYRMKVCLTTGEDCVLETLHWHFLGSFLIFVIMFFFVTKIPERFAPGRFDYLGHSHQLFHLSAVALTTLQMWAFPKDATVRRETLTALADFHPDFRSTFLLYLLVQACGLALVVIFAVLVKKRILISNKIEVIANLLAQEKKK